MKTPVSRLWRVAALALLCALAAWPSVARQPVAGGVQPYIASVIGASAADLSSIARGRAVVKTLEAANRREVTTAGAIRIKAEAAAFVSRFRTLEGFRTSQFVHQVARFSEPPTLEDLGPLTIDEDDVKAWPKCRPGDCGVRLTGEGIARMQPGGTGSEADTERVARYKMLLFEHVMAHRAGGAARLPVYADQAEPLPLGEEIGSILEQTPTPLARAPALLDYLHAYPAGALARTESFYYWSKEAFGFKPVVGLYHVALHTTFTDETFIVTTQIYASHYMDGQVAINVLLPDRSDASPAFYWLYHNRARIGRMDSFLGSLSRSIVQRRARNGLSRSLTQTRERMEAGTPMDRQARAPIDSPLRLWRTMEGPASGGTFRR